MGDGSSEKTLSRDEQPPIQADACRQSQRPENFWIDTTLGVLLLGVVANFAYDVGVTVWKKVVWSLLDLQGKWRALEELYSSRLPWAPQADMRESAATIVVQEVSEATPRDLERREEERRQRHWIRAAMKKCQTIATNARSIHNPRSTILPVTNQQQAAASSSAANYTPDQLHYCTDSWITSRSPEEDAVRDVSIGIMLPETTLRSGKEAEKFQGLVQECLRPMSNAHVSPPRDGSTFLSATVSVATSAAVEELLKCAQRLVKMGVSYDSACTVQLGNAALLYGVSADVETTILQEGLHDIPFITSAKRFGKRTIVIKGSYLENTEVKATTQNYGESFSLHVLYHRKLEKGLDMLLVQVPSGMRTLSEGFQVHAKKSSIKLEGCTNDFVLRSNDVEVGLCEPQTADGPVIRIFAWRLLICVLALYTQQVMIVGPWQASHAAWIVLLFKLFLCFFCIEYILAKLAPWTYNIIIRCLELLVRLKQVDRILMSRDVDNKMIYGAASVEHSSAAEVNQRGGETVLHKKRVTISDGGRLHADSDEDIDDANYEGAVPVTDPNWEWPCLERTFHRGKWTTVQRRAGGRAQGSSVQRPFEVLTTVHHEGVVYVELIVNSPLLVQVLNSSSSAGAQFATGCAVDPKDLFLRLESLRRLYASSTARSDQEIEAISATAPVDDLSESQLTVLYLKHLLRFMQRHFAETLLQYERMQAQGSASFDMLWAFFKPGEGVRRKCQVTNEDCFATVKRLATYGTDKYGLRYCSIELNVMDFNVESYHRCSMKYKIYSFDGEVPLTSLDVCPLSFFPNRKDMEAGFLSMGAAFYRVAMQQPFRFMQFTGSLNFYSLDHGCWTLHKLNGDGRVMVDLLSFARMNPDYPLENAQPPCAVMTGKYSPGNRGQMKEPSQEALKLSPAFAYGFSFRAKKWGCFEVCGLRDITFNIGAFSELKMTDENQKEMLWNVAQPLLSAAPRKDHELQAAAGSTVLRIMKSGNQLDPIANKGAGCIVLCHGPPGTGKTLTAEALAESMGRPLWSISAFELGDKPGEVEAMLTQIMEIAYKWRAVLLLDEADAFLQRRDLIEGGDVQRYLLTGVFLRVLEYHRGIMFLTTNRVTAFDDAILSRTSMAIAYPALEETQRLEIWKRLCAGVPNVSYEALRHYQLNGRQIRNIVHVAQLLANGRNEPLSFKHVRNAIDAHVANAESLQAASAPPIN